MRRARRRPRAAGRAARGSRPVACGGCTRARSRCRDRLAAGAGHLPRAGRRDRAARRRTRTPPRGARAELGVRAAIEPELAVDERRVHEAVAARARGRPAPAARVAVRARRHPAGGRRTGPCSAPLRHPLQPTDHAGRAARRPPVPGACRAGASPPTSLTSSRSSSSSSQRRGSARSDERRIGRVRWSSSSSEGSLLAPLLPGLVQHWKARLQGRRGPSPLQPYRELARLWRKSDIDVDGTTLVYRLAPPVVGRRARSGRVARAGRGRDAGAGRRTRLFVLGGLLALARFAVCTAAWDTENGFALMGASRDLTISVFTEAALVSRWP